MENAKGEDFGLCRKQLRCPADSRHGHARWFADAVEQDKTAGCVDLDLGFTPATNLIAIRRLALKVGQSAQAAAAYLAFPQMRLEKLDQIYHRTGRMTYDYTAARFGYDGTLELGASGGVVNYPGLFEQVRLRPGG